MVSSNRQTSFNAWRALLARPGNEGSELVEVFRQGLRITPSLLSQLQIKGVKYQPSTKKRTLWMMMQSMVISKTASTPFSLFSAPGKGRQRTHRGFLSRQGLRVRRFSLSQLQKRGAMSAVHRQPKLPFDDDAINGQQQTRFNTWKRFWPPRTGKHSASSSRCPNRGHE